ncbi:hypothetical protein PGT21_015872 [Puccinia graminis f. sp. tritici]|uniref:Uncharacterized protein n=1 Tax=Puccinia graminis f. sp. tritici TaxID=56615 RepID=A0A5B0Q307_PUCGR|nr:hypothetical protein PGT21_015872 [Puccinia graminis f. sp. tritici]
MKIDGQERTRFSVGLIHLSLNITTLLHPYNSNTPLHSQPHCSMICESTQYTRNLIGTQLAATHPYSQPRQLITTQHRTPHHCINLNGQLVISPFEFQQDF